MGELIENWRSNTCYSGKEREGEKVAKYLNHWTEDTLEYITEDQGI